MTQWEEIIQKLENGKALIPAEIDYIKKVFDAANTASGVPKNFSNSAERRDPTPGVSLTASQYV